MLSIVRSVAIAGVVVVASATHARKSHSLRNGVLESAILSDTPSVKESKITIDHVNREGAGDNSPYKGVDYLGIGYDYMKGNPEGDPDTMVDPGFRLPVVDLEWSQNMPTRDTAFLQPKHGYALPEHACHHSAQATMESTMTDYSKNLEVDASLSMEGSYKAVTGGFSLSQGYRNFNQEVVSEESERFMYKSYCLQFLFGIKPDVGAGGLKGTQSFQTAVASLPSVVPERPALCKTHECMDMYNQESKTYIQIIDGKLAVSTASPSGVWIVKDDHFHWLDQGKTLRQASKVLTLTNEHALTFAALNKEVDPESDEADMQRFAYDAGSQTFVSSLEVKEDPDAKLTVHVSNDAVSETGFKIFLEKQDRSANEKFKRVHVDAAAEKQWMDFFQTYGTHYLDTVHLGGRMVTEITISAKSKQQIEEMGMTTEAAVQAGFGIGPLDVGNMEATAKKKKNKDKTEELSKIEKRVKTYVVGGSPPATGGEDEAAFGKWAATVPEAPMPVRYSMSPFSKLASMAPKRPDYELMLQRYGELAVAESEDYFADVIQAKVDGRKPGESAKPLSYLDSGMQICSNSAVQNRLENKEGFSAVIEPSGNFVVYRPDKTVLWTSQTINGKNKAGPYCVSMSKTFGVRLRGFQNADIWSTKTDPEFCGSKKKFYLSHQGELILTNTNSDKKIWSSHDGHDLGTESRFEGKGKRRCKLSAGVYGGGLTKSQLLRKDAWTATKFAAKYLNAVGLQVMAVKHGADAAKKISQTEAYKKADFLGVTPALEKQAAQAGSKIGNFFKKRNIFAKKQSNDDEDEGSD